MSVIAFWAGIAWNILLWIFRIWLGIFAALLLGCVLAGWYRRLRYRRRERQARASTLRAREERLLRAGVPMGALHPEHGPAMSSEERRHLAVIESQFSSKEQPS